MLILSATKRLLDRLGPPTLGEGDAELAAFLNVAAIVVGVGGGSVMLDVDGVPVFAKRIPITDRELAHPHSTANLNQATMTQPSGSAAWQLAS